MGCYTIVYGPVPGAQQRIVAMHDAHYGRHWGFGAAFTAKNLAELSAFLGAYDPELDGLWTLHADGAIEGSIAIHGSRAESGAAELRWFLVGEALRGQGAGSRLLDEALTFCRQRGFDRVHLWTFAGLDEARRLYEKAGFVLVEEWLGTRWGTEVTEQHLECVLRPDADR